MPLRFQRKRRLETAAPRLRGIASGAGHQCTSSHLSLSTLVRNSGAVAAPNGKQQQVCTGANCTVALK
nr:unnamed protein product [Callosobruchus analis]